MKNFRMSLLFILLLSFLMGCSPILKTSGPASKQSTEKSALSDCPLDFKKVAYCGQLAPLQKTLIVGNSNQYKLGFWQKDVANFMGPYSDPGLTPHVWLWMVMPTGSHGSLPVLVSQDIDASGIVVPGVYQVSQVVYTMPCRSQEEWWEIHVELKKADGTIADEAVQKLCL
jgi:hypothetical protein